MIYARSIRPAVRLIGACIGVAVGTLFKTFDPTTAGVRKRLKRG